LEKLSDFFKSIRERITNPIVFSFILSWLVWNWEVTLLLIYADSASSIIASIDKKKIFFWPPVLFAISYTILSPLIKNLVRAFQTWCTKWGENWNLGISKEQNVPISKVLYISEEYAKKSKILEDIIKDRNKTIEDFDKEHTKLLLEQQKSAGLIEQNNAISNELSVLKSQMLNAFNVNILNGTWECTTLKESGEKITEELHINGGQISVLEFNQVVPIFDIKDFYINLNDERIFFVKYTKPEVLSSTRKRHGDLTMISYNIDSSNIKFFINELKMMSNSRLEGTENVTDKIVYQRKL